jgi:hypothetical protein
MSFMRLWLLGYLRPIKMVKELQMKPAPHWGLLAQLVRSLLDALLLYLPLSLMGQIPPTPSHLSLFPTERYYGTLVWLAPLVLMSVLLMQAAVMHIVIRLLGRKSDFDQVINITGMAALVVGSALLVWDWLWFAIGGIDQYLLGYSHILLSLWAAAITVIGLKRNLGVPICLGVPLALLGIPIAFPFAIMFMRSPM